MLINIAHRGLSAIAPENTLYSFDRALQSGMNHLEFDIQLSSDKIPVVIHDDRLDRTTNLVGKVNERTIAELRKAQALNNFNSLHNVDKKLLGIPTLDDLLIRYTDKAHLYIELKSPDHALPEIVAESLIKNNALKYSSSPPQSAPGLTIIGFSLEQVLRSKYLLPKVKHGWLRYDLHEIDINLVSNLELDGIYPFVKNIKKDLVHFAKKKNIVVGVWGVETKKEYNNLLSMEVHGATVNWVP